MAVEMKCPGCGNTMVIIEFQQVELDYCPACEGCWLDAGELGLILTGAPEIPASFFGGTSSKGKRRCPHCNKKMNVSMVPETNVQIDACPLHHGIWLDQGELLAIVNQRGNKELAGYCEAIFAHTLTKKEGVS